MSLKVVGSIISSSLSSESFANKEKQDGAELHSSYQGGGSVAETRSSTPTGYGAWTSAPPC